MIWNDTYLSSSSLIQETFINVFEISINKWTRETHRAFECFLCFKWLLKNDDFPRKSFRHFPARFKRGWPTNLFHTKYPTTQIEFQSKPGCYVNASCSRRPKIFMMWKVPIKSNCRSAKIQNHGATASVMFGNHEVLSFQYVTGASDKCVFDEIPCVRKKSIFMIDNASSETRNWHFTFEFWKYVHFREILQIWMAE